jgi:hypothetical protein
MRISRTCRVRALSAAASLVLLAAFSAAAAPPTDLEIKAAFLYNFTKFTDWPRDSFSGPGDPLRLCVLGKSPFGGSLATSLKGKTVNGRELAVTESASLAEAARCHLVFISESEESRLDDVLYRLGRLPVLTVSDIEAFAERGGTIGLKIVDRRVRFDVNVAASRLSGLKLGSQLLKVAMVLVDQPGQAP